MIPSEIDIQLTTELEYHYQGSPKKTTCVTLRAPSNKQRKYVAKLKQGFFRAIENLRNTDQTGASDNKNEISGSDVLALVLMSEAVQFDEYLETFMMVATTGGVLIDGEEPMTSVLWERLSYEDAESMLGEYLAGFMLAAWMSGR